MNTLPPVEPAALRVLLVDDGAHRVGQIQDELVQQGHVVVGVVDSAVALHDSVLKLRPDVVIVDADSPSRDTLEHLATLSAQLPRPVVVFAEDEADDPMRRAMAAGVSAYVVAGLQARRIAPCVQALVGAAFVVEPATCASEVGSGASPVETIASAGLAIRVHDSRGGQRALLALNAALRALPWPVIGRIADGALVLDLRCLSDEAAFLANLAHLPKPESAA